MSDREVILGKLPQPDGKAAASVSAQFAHISSETDLESLWAMFAANLETLGGRIIKQDEWHRILDRPRWCDPFFQLENTAESLWKAEVGVSRAIGAVAKSGTLILEAGAQTLRTSSLVPPINLVEVDHAAIVPTLHEAMARLSRRTTVLVTGPSRTADIEGVMVRGVHGPGQLLVHVRRT